MGSVEEDLRWSLILSAREEELVAHMAGGDEPLGIKDHPRRRNIVPQKGGVIAPQSLSVIIATAATETSIVESTKRNARNQSAARRKVSN
jgi:hypothetical protein